MVRFFGARPYRLVALRQLLFQNIYTSGDVKLLFEQFYTPCRRAKCSPALRAAIRRFGFIKHHGLLLRYDAGIAEWGQRRIGHE